jgi:hypothetical protein
MWRITGKRPAPLSQKEAGMAAHEQPGDGWTVVLIRPFAGVI